MGSSNETLQPELLERVLERLGLPRAPTPDHDGLCAFYSAWCASVPFDNVRKWIALSSGESGPLPGGEARDFLEAWLTHGAGGTCWPASNALHAVARSLGFDARRITGAMRDLGLVNHGSVRVRMPGGEWLLDASLLTNVPLPLDDQSFVHDDPVFAVEVEPVEGSHLVWLDVPPESSHLPCRLHAGEASHDDYLAAYERSRSQSPFNQRLYARRNLPGELLVLRGNVRYSRTRAGVESLALSPEELGRALCDEIGLSEELVERWTEAGGRAASLVPEPPPAPALGRPPSQRGHDVVESLTEPAGA